MIGINLLAGYGVKASSLGPELATPAGLLRLAVHAYRSGDDKIAYVLFERLANKGNPRAECWLAHAPLLQGRE